MYTSSTNTNSQTFASFTDSKGMKGRRKHSEYSKRSLSQLFVWSTHRINPFLLCPDSKMSTRVRESQN